MPPLLIEKLLDLSFSSIKPIEAFLPLPNSLLFVIGRKEGVRRDERREEEKLRKEEGGSEEIADKEEERLGEEVGQEEVEGKKKEDEGKGGGGRREVGGGGRGRGGGRREEGNGKMDGGGMSRFQLFCEVWDLKNFTIVSEMMLDAYGVKYLCDFAIYEDNVIMNVKSTFGIKKIIFLDVLTKKRWSSKIELRKKIRKVNMKEDRRNEHEGEGGKKISELEGGDIEVIGEMAQGREEEVKKKGKRGAIALEGKELEIEREVLVGNDHEREITKDLRREDGIIKEKLEERRENKKIREENERCEETEDIGSGIKDEGMEEVLKSGIFRVKLGKIVYYEIISMVKPMIFQNSFDCYTLIILEVYSYDASKLDLQLKFRRSAIKKEQTSLISILKEGDFILIWDGFSNEITLWDLLHPSDLYYFSANFSGIKPIKLFFPQPTFNHPPPTFIPPPPAASILPPSSSISISPSPLLVCLLVKEQPTNLIKVLTLNLKKNTILSRNIMKIEEILDPGEYLDVYKVKILLFKKSGNTNIAFSPHPSLFPFTSSYYSETDIRQIIEERLNRGGEGEGKKHKCNKEGEIWRRMRMCEGMKENEREEEKYLKRKREDDGIIRSDERKEEEERRLYLLIMLQMRGKLEYLKYFLYLMEENEENDFKFVWKCQKENQINYGFELKEEFTVCRTEVGDGGLYLRIFFLDE